METARIIGATDVMTAIPGLFYAENDARGHIVDEAFEKLGHAPLQDYIEYGTAVTDALASLGADAGKAILEATKHMKEGKVLIIGHGVLIPAICTYFVHGDSHFMRRVLKECEGIRLQLDESDRVVAWHTIP